MYFEFPCAKCKKSLKIPEARRGSKVRCPHCNHAQVPHAPPATQLPQDLPLPSLDDLSDPMSLLGDPFAPAQSSAAAPTAAKSPPKPAAPLPPETSTEAGDGEPAKDGHTSSPLGRDRGSRGTSARKKGDASAHLKFECPQCNQHLSAPPVLAGQVVNCPSCGNRVRAGVPQDRAAGVEGNRSDQSPLPQNSRHCGRRARAVVPSALAFRPLG